MFSATWDPRRFRSLSALSGKGKKQTPLPLKNIIKISTENNNFIFAWVTCY